MNRTQELLARALEETLDETERAELRDALENDPTLREKWARQSMLHGLLGPALECADASERRVAACMRAVNKADRDGFVRGVESKIRRVRFKHRLIWAAAAALVIGLLSLWAIIPRPVAIVARISAINGETSLREGARFFKGDRLRIESGLVELDLSGRGRMIVEGPAELRWSGQLGATLEQGRVLLRVNERGHGYRLETPEGSVVDLGTEFGVFIEPATGKVETHVIDGEVKALPGGGGKPILLRKNEALHLQASHSVRIPADPGAFYRSMPPRHSNDISMVHWSMEADGRATVLPRTRSIGEELPALVMKNGPQPVEGPFGMAMHFDGKGAYAETSYRGIEGKRPRTVAFWVKIPRDFDPSQGYAMASWGDFDINNPGSVWQISTNPDADDGPIGRLRVGVHGGKAIGTTDLRDDQWHHVAVVLYPAATPSFGQHVMLFLDGTVDPVSSRTLGKIETKVEDATHGVWLGRNITGAPGSEFFRGAIDEVYIFDAALSQEEIRALMKYNKLPISLEEILEIGH